MKALVYALLSCAVVAHEVAGQGFTFQDTRTAGSADPIVGRARSVEKRRDDPNDPYPTNGEVPAGGPIYNAGLSKEPPAPGDAAPGGCICVPYYQCTDGVITDDGSGILGARVLARNKNPPAQEIALDPSQGGDPNCPGIDQLCCREPSASTVIPPVFTCGIRNDNGINSRILSKNMKGEAEFGEWPWQAAILRAEDGQVHFECGGTLVSERHVLTVGHCVYKVRSAGSPPLVVRLGEWDTRSNQEFYPHEDFQVANIIVHPQFRNTSLWNDLAILELSSPVSFRPHISPICLPNPGESYEGHDCVVTGWGKNAYRTGSYSNIMKEVKVPVIENVNCQEKLRRTRLGSYFKLHEGFLCAGSREGEDSCKGDGGGPLSCYRNDGRYSLAGLVSWGIDCGTNDVPGVYVRLTKYLDWISHATGRPLTDFYPK